MTFNFFKRKKPDVLEVVEPPKPDNRIDAESIKYILSISSLVISIATHIYVKGAGK